MLLQIAVSRALPISNNRLVPKGFITPDMYDRFRNLAVKHEKISFEYTPESGKRFEITLQLSPHSPPNPGMEIKEISDDASGGISEITLFEDRRIVINYLRSSTSGNGSDPESNKRLSINAIVSDKDTRELELNLFPDYLGSASGRLKDISCLEDSGYYRKLVQEHLDIFYTILPFVEGYVNGDRSVPNET